MHLSHASLAVALDPTEKATVKRLELIVCSSGARQRRLSFDWGGGGGGHARRLLLAVQFGNVHEKPYPSFQHHAAPYFCNGNHLNVFPHESFVALCICDLCLTYVLIRTFGFFF